MSYNVIIIGAGAAGLMTAMSASNLGKKVLIIEHNKKIAEKIRISGGGRCNFTNIFTTYKNYLSHNDHFCKSALSRYTPNDFIALLDNYNIKYHEKKLGQLFCDRSAQDIINMFQNICLNNGVEFLLETKIISVKKNDNFEITIANRSSEQILHTDKLVIATGGLSIPKIGATDFAYKIAKQFDINITALYAGLVPLIFSDDILELYKKLAGISIDAEISCENTRPPQKVARSVENKVFRVPKRSVHEVHEYRNTEKPQFADHLVEFLGRSTKFREGMLFTHRGISGPSVLQISSYLKADSHITINFLPDFCLFDWLIEKKQTSSKQFISNILAEKLPKNFVTEFLDFYKISGKIAELSDKKLQFIHDLFHKYSVKPSGTEGYRTAEVTCGGIDVNEISSKTMESKKIKGLYFVGEALDVTGHLGGFNFQWAWASGYVCGMDI